MTKLAAARDAGHGAEAILEGDRHAGLLGEGPAGVALDDPQVGADAVHQQRRVLHQPAVDAAHAHDDHEQQADADGGQHEPAEVVPDVAAARFMGP